MSTINVTVEQVASITPHPNADRLEIAKILGTQTVVPKGQYKSGDRIIFFPPDILVPQDVSQSLGIQKYLKQGEINGIKCRCRVAACRLRSIPSFGFIIPAPVVFRASPIGSDVSEAWSAEKYEPTQSACGKRHFNGDIAPACYAFYRYTNIEHYWRHPDVIKPGTPVRITEKIHGTNSRAGLIDGNFMGGSNKTNRKKFDSQGRPSLYWVPFENQRVIDLLLALSGAEQRKNIIVYGEIYGQGIQDLDYGGAGYRIFDISVDGLYLGYEDLVAATCHLETVPLLYRGPFKPELVEEFTHGPTEVGKPKCKFKGREGCVITPLTEQWDVKVGRVILKSVSADYLDRRHATDN